MLLWDTLNWRETTSLRNIYYPPWLHSDQALQLLKASAAPSLFLILSAPFWAHQHFMPAQTYSSQEWAWLFSNSHLPSIPNMHFVYQLSAITDVTGNSLSLMTSASNSFKHTLTSNFLYPSLSPVKFGCSTLSTTAAAFHTEVLCPRLHCSRKRQSNNTIPRVTSPL